jgi:hypothetical protein
MVTTADAPIPVSSCRLVTTIAGFLRVNADALAAHPELPSLTLPTGLFVTPVGRATRRWGLLGQA